jgi:hypothetical protein
VVHVTHFANTDIPTVCRSGVGILIAAMRTSLSVTELSVRVGIVWRGEKQPD